MINDKVSIIVPIYNVEQYLKKCVDSLIHQTHKNIEIYLVDDGSPDKSGSLCDQLAKKDDRIKVVHKENGGYGSVLEYSIKNISSEYFLICDPDDWLELDAIELLLKNIISYKADLVVARKKIVYTDGAIRSDKNQFESLRENKKYTDLTPFLGIPCSPHAKLYKTSFCKNIKFPKKINNTDYLLYHVYLTNINSAVYIDQEIANYFIDRPGNSFNEDIALTEKSLRSNSLVTKYTFEQLNSKSSLYEYSVINLFVRSCSYLALMNKFNLNNEEYKSIFEDVIKKSKRYKKTLKKYLKRNNNSVIKVYIKKFIFSMFYNELTKKIGITMLRVFK